MIQKKFNDNLQYDLRTELDIPKETKLVGVVAVLRRAKRHQELIEVFAKLNSDVKLVIVGDGPQKENLLKLIKNMNLQDKVIMLGHRDDVDKLLPNFDIFC